MKILIIYDSMFGNTEKVANKIVQSFPEKDIKLVHIAKAELKDIESCDLAIFGSPTHGGQPSAPISEFLKKLPKDALKGKLVAAFDTRFSKTEHGLGLKMLMNMIGFAAEKMLTNLKTKGGKPVLPGKGFIVNDKEGPLSKGELARATKWADEIKGKID